MINVGDLVVGIDPTSNREHTAKVLEVTNSDRDFWYVKVDIADDPRTVQTETILRVQRWEPALPARVTGDPGPSDW